MEITIGQEYIRREGADRYPVTVTELLHREDKPLVGYRYTSQGVSYGMMEDLFKLEFKPYVRGIVEPEEVPPSVLEAEIWKQFNDRAAELKIEPPPTSVPITENSVESMFDTLIAPDSPMDNFGVP